MRYPWLRSRARIVVLNSTEGVSEPSSRWWTFTLLSRAPSCNLFNASESSESTNAPHKKKEYTHDIYTGP